MAESNKSQSDGGAGAFPRAGWALVAAAGLILAIFYSAVPLFFENHGSTPFKWLWMCWQSDKLDYEHGKLIPLAIVFLLWRRRKEIAAEAVKPRWWGLLVLGLGVLIYLASARTLQPRLSLGALPIMVLGAAIYVHGLGMARLLMFPAFLLYFGIPIPGLLQATNELQVIATTGAYKIITLAGIEATAAGNNITSTAEGGWGFDVAEGCSGVRSLMALTLIAAVYGHLVHKALWKKVVLFLFSFPLAIVANTFRVASIIFIAEFINPEFAGSLYHDYSGFLFFPFGLVGLVLCSKVLDFSKHFGKRVSVVKRDGEEPQGVEVTDG